MRVAAYARYSSDSQRDASIDDQFRNCEQFAARQGWSIIQRYRDEAISGSTDERHRPGYRSLLVDAKGRSFDALIVDDLSRLSRDEAELIMTRRKLRF